MNGAINEHQERVDRGQIPNVQKNKGALVAKLSLCIWEETKPARGI